MNKAPLIFELKNASFAYMYELALKNVNFKVSSGEKICVIGANGSGKTTLLRILAGISYPQSGSFYAFGKKVLENNFNDDNFACSYHKRVGFIFQNTDAQLFCTSVKEEIAFGPLQIGVSKKDVECRIDDVAKMLDIEALLPKAPFNLSGGEKKKVAIAAVLALNPEVLVLDEPTNGLDPRSRRWLINLLLSLSDAGKTIITSTHSLRLAREISVRSILFNEDHTIACDAPTTEILRDTDLLKRVNLVDEGYTFRD